MWHPEDESLFTHKREKSLDLSPPSSIAPVADEYDISEGRTQHHIVPSIPSSISQSSALPVFPMMRAASNEFGEEDIDKKVRRLDMDGINSIISPFLGYVDLMNNEPIKALICGYHIQVQNELIEHPQVVHIDDVVDDMEMTEGAYNKRDSEMNIEANFDVTSPSKVDTKLCSREKIRGRRTIHQIVRQLSSMENPSPFLIFTFTSSLSNLLLSMNRNERDSVVGSVCSSLPPSYLPFCDESDR